MSIDRNTLHVIAVISNPVRWKSRMRLFHQFEKHMKCSNVNLVTVECSFGDRPHELDTQDAYGTHVKLRTWDELWLKEAMINVGISKLPLDWEYVAWIDADVMFSNTDWVQETIHQLQHHMVVQMFQNAVDTGPAGEILKTFTGFAYSYVMGKPYPVGHKNGIPHGEYVASGSSGEYFHPGFAWAARREAIDHVGGLIDFAILGSGDHHMALSLVGKGDLSIPDGLHSNYRSMVMQWQSQAERFIRRDIGFVPGTLIHYFHGPKGRRQYWNRWQILKDNNFDPMRDIKRDWQGLYQLVDHGDLRSIQLRDGIRAYFRQRHEDDTCAT